MNNITPPRIADYTFHVVFKVVQKMNVWPMEFKGLAWKDLGPFKITLVALLANLVAELLLRGLAGRVHDQKTRFVARDVRLDELARLRHEENLCLSSVRVSEQAIAALFEAPALLFVKPPGENPNRRNVRFEILRIKAAIKRDDTLLQNGKLGLKEEEMLRSNIALLKFLEEYEAAYRLACERYLLTQRRRRTVQRVIDRDLPMPEQNGVQCEIWSDVDDLAKYVVLDLSSSDPLLDHGVVPLLRSHDHKWWTLFATKLEKQVQTDVIKYPYKIMLRDPLLIAGAKSLSEIPSLNLCEGGLLTQVCQDPRKFNPKTLFPKQEWTPAEIASFGYENRSDDQETVEWLLKQGGGNHPYHPFPSRLTNEENIVIGRSRKVYRDELLALLKRRPLDRKPN